MDFGFPLFTSTLHMAVQFVCAALCLRFVWPTLRPSKLPSARDYLLKVVPCGIATGLDIGLSNSSLKAISLTFYTMVKSGAPVFVLLFAFLFKLEKPTWKLSAIIMLICSGVLLMVGGESKFNLQGYLEVQIATILSGFRWSITQILLAKASLGMSNPLATAIFLAPVMSLSLLITSLASEDLSTLATHPLVQSSPFTLVVLLAFGGILAFSMVMAEFNLISATNVVTFSVAGVFKEILTIVISSLVFRDADFTISKLLGLVTSLVGIALYNYVRIVAIREQATLARRASTSATTALATNRNTRQRNGEYEAALLDESGLWTGEDDGDDDGDLDDAVAAIYGASHGLYGYSNTTTLAPAVKLSAANIAIELESVNPLFSNLN
ncbi:Triose-phosphate Transporter [Physocladia obscura]|uniref:Triose-phosphate Transporter n=1 Tax=Physocladia obscura TaxID=109957 RepID=A0AAD5XG62_9FUNG|nr:Triose-phosphate Transporter [Physocladia obscura]